MPTKQYNFAATRIRQLIFVASTIGVFAMLALVFVSGTIGLYQNYNMQRELIRGEMTERHRAVTKERVLNFVQLVEHERSEARNDWNRRLKVRVDYALSIAGAIYENNKSNMNQAQIKRLIVSTLGAMKRADGTPFVLVYDTDHNALITFAAASNKDAKQYAEQVERPLAEKKLQELSGQGGRYFEFKIPKINDMEKVVEQLSYAKMFEPYDLMFEAVEYADFLEAELQNDILSRLGMLRFGSDYLFIDTYDGYALLSDGMLQSEPKYLWNLTDPNGVKILQEQLKVALSTPEGGFLSYGWLDPDGEVRTHLSYVTVIPQWRWKVGASGYQDQLEEDIQGYIEILYKETRQDAWTLILIVLVLAVLSFAGALYLNRRFNILFREMCEHIEKMHSEMQARIESETKRRLKGEELLMQSSKMADMGNMMGLIIHQWKQPLGALSLWLDDLAESRENPAHIDTLISEAERHIAYMTETVTDFRNFLKPDVAPSEFSLQELLISTAKLINHRLTQSHTKLNLPPQDITIRTLHNDLRQVMINLFGNACDANEEQIKKGAAEFGVIDCSWEIADGFVHLSINDNGGGISEQLQLNLFQPYVSTKGESGTGLGLYMSRRIIEERIRGTLTVSNKNGGACFVITIPSVR